MHSFRWRAVASAYGADGRFRRGEIHIDHRRPQSSFDLNDADQVRACWALSNLQPLWARDNLTKGARWDGPTD
ncbi:hypothetical protein WK62_19750 [Burkholderia ubonensis]|nr:hypothetical protein WK62_19750 [Burkholderia ubonensis]